MVFIAEKKYACEACIKGHRASVCQHTDRPLYEIKRKGRPVSQCDHCRQLRKSKQVHVKCMCALDRSNDEGYASSSACDCDRTGICHCCTTRTPYSGRKPKTREAKASPTPPSSEREGSAGDYTLGPADFVDAAHLNGHRPLLSRPPEPQLQPQSHELPYGVSSAPACHASGSHHQLEPQPISHGNSCCSHGAPSEQMHMIEGHAPPYALVPLPAQHPSAFPESTPYSFVDLSAPTSELDAWMAAFPTPISVPMQAQSWNTSLCGCGDGCGCLGCPEHDPTAGDAPCMDAHTCRSCLECILVTAPEVQGQDMSTVGGVPGLDGGGQENRSFDMQPFGMQADFYPTSSLVMPGKAP